MAVQALTDAFIYGAGYDFTGDTNDVKLAMDAATLDRTTFGSGSWREVAGGAKSHVLDVAGFWQAGTASVDVESFNDLGTTNRVFTIGAADTENTLAYMFRSAKMRYQALDGGYGELAKFALGASGTDGQGVIRGKLAKAKANVSGTGATGTGLQLGAVAADEFLYATFHVFSAGTTITVVVESDDNAGFSSATTRITFGPITTAGGTWGTRVAGAITDDYYRLRITAITGTFSIAGAIGIGY